MFRKLRVWIVLVVGLAAASGGYYYYALASQPAQSSEAPQVQTTVARQGDLTIFATGTGSLIAASEVDLSFDFGGVIAVINVEVGDTVEAGAVLARLEEGEALATFESSLTSAELAHLNAQQALEAINKNAPMQSAEAQKALAEAIEGLSDAEYFWQVQQQGYRASGDTVAAAEANLVLAKQQVDRAQGEYNKYSGRSDNDPAKALALSNLVAAKQQRDSILRGLNWYTGSPSDIDQAILDADLVIAQATLEQAQQAWDILKDGPDPDEVALAEAQLANAAAQLAKAEADLEEAVAAQDEIELVAPIGGTVLAVNAAVGESASGVVITLADLSQPYLEIFVDETDLEIVRVGLEADVIFDALPDDTFQGTVVQIDPALFTSQGVSAIRALVQLQPSASLEERTLPIGLGASVDVVAGRAINAVLVPIEALRELSPGEFAVFVMQNGEPQLRFVEVGLVDFTFAEITSGLEAGEIITTGIVETG